MATRARRPAKNGRPRKPRAITQDDLSGLAVEGYKSLLVRQSIDIRPLTLLAGANSSGKSSILQPLLLLKQTMEAPFDPGALLLDGPNVSITSAEQLLARRGTKASAAKTFSIRLSTSRESVTLEFGKERRAGLEIRHMETSSGEGHVRLTEQMSNQEIRRLLPQSLLYVDQNIVKGNENLTWSVVRNRCFLTLDIVDNTIGTPIGTPIGLGLGFGPFGQPRYETIVQNIIHVPGLRGNPERTYKTTAVGPTFPGTFETYVASLILYWQSTNDSRLHSLREDLEELGLTWKVEAKPVDDTRVELRVGRLTHPRQGGAQDLVSIADVGFGVSQTLPVIVALLAARQGQVVYIEQPEIHLHPRAQIALAALLARAASRGVIAIVETHSALLIRGIQTIVARGELDPGRVALHWFKRRESDGATTVESGDVDRAGAFGEWPIDFDDVALSVDHDYLDAASHRLFAE